MTIVLLISSAKFCCSAPDTLVTGFISPNDAYNGVTYTELLVELDLPRKEPRADVKNFSPSFLPSSPPHYRPTASSCHLQPAMHHYHSAARTTVPFHLALHVGFIVREHPLLAYRYTQ